MAAVLAAPEPPATRGRRMLAPAATIGGLALATLALHCATRTARHLGLLPERALGFSCPGCGGLRAVNDLTHGDVGAALSSNIVVDADDPGRRAAPRAVVGRPLARPPRQVAWARLRPVVIVLLTVLVVFTVMRNTGPGAWLAP